MKCVSVIVPLYYGKRYIKRLISQVEEAGRLLGTDDIIELVLVNDAPNDLLEEKEYVSDYIKIVVLNTDINRGIHGARVWGLSHAKGEYVMFLDQDDIIKENCINSQLSKIGNADAIVCRLINGNKLQYTDSYVFEEVITKDFMLHNWNPIVSPGQVLMKKSAIPDIWKQSIMVHNGADDYFLWLCMMAIGKEFVLNQEVLFEHIVTGSNTSGDTNLMMDSEREMVQTLLKSNIFSQEDEKCLQRLPDSLRRAHMTELDTYRNAYNVYDRWFSRTLEGDDPAKIFYAAGIRTVAIYGAGYIGKSIFKLLKNSSIQVLFYIDRNAEYIDLEIPVYTIQDSLQGVDGIIISLFKGVDSIKENLSGKFNCPIYAIREIISGETE